MEYKRKENQMVIRLNRGEEIISSLMEIFKKEKIYSASVAGIGASDKFTIGAYNVSKKEYKKNTFYGEYEIVSLLGNVSKSEKEDAPYIHLHICLADDKGKSLGGHLNEAYISATCEIFVNIKDIEIGRKKDEETGLYLFKF